jgi:hypothetical protein
VTILALCSWIKPLSQTNMFLLVFNFHNLEIIFGKKWKKSENSRENVNNKRKKFKRKKSYS